MSDLAAPGSGELAYMLVAEDIAARIASGELAPGTRLRSERELASHYGRAYGTIRKAMEELRKRGLIESIHGRGTYVKAPPPPPSGGGTGGASGPRM